MGLKRSFFSFVLVACAFAVVLLVPLARAQQTQQAGAEYLRRAYDSYQSMAQSSPYRAIAWQPLGPTNISGPFMHARSCWRGGYGAIAQLGERLLCKQEVVGSIPSGSTSPLAGPKGG